MGIREILQFPKKAFTRAFSLLKVPTGFLAGAFNQEKVLYGTFSGHCKILRSPSDSSSRKQEVLRLQIIILLRSLQPADKFRVRLSAGRKVGQSCLDVAYRLRNRQFGAGIYIFVCFLLFSFKLLSFFWAMPRLHLPKSKTELYLSDSNSRLSHHKLKYKYLKNMEIVAFEYKTLWPSLMHFLVL